MHELWLRQFAMLNGCCLSFFSDDALGGEVCVVPVIEVRWWPVCIKHVVLSPVWTMCWIMCCPELVVPNYVLNYSCIEPWCCIELCLSMLYMEVWCYSCWYVDMCVDIVIDDAIYVDFITIYASGGLRAFLKLQGRWQNRQKKSNGYLCRRHCRRHSSLDIDADDITVGIGQSQMPRAHQIVPRVA